MSTGKHYGIEQNDKGTFTVKADGADLSSASFTTLREAIDHVKKLNPNDRPDLKQERMVSPQ